MLTQVTIKDENISKDVAASTEVVYFSYTVPPRAKFRLTHFANYLDTMTAWGSVIWKIKVNGVGKYPYDSLKDQYGYAAEPRPIAPIELAGGEKLEIAVRNDFPTTVGIGIAFRYEIE